VSRCARPPITPMPTSVRRSVRFAVAGFFAASSTTSSSARSAASDASGWNGGGSLLRLRSVAGGGSLGRLRSRRIGAEGSY